MLAHLILAEVHVVAPSNVEIGSTVRVSTLLVLATRLVESTHLSTVTVELGRSKLGSVILDHALEKLGSLDRLLIVGDTIESIGYQLIDVVNAITLGIGATSKHELAQSAELGGSVDTRVNKLESHIERDTRKTLNREKELKRALREL